VHRFIPQHLTECPLLPFLCSRQISLVLFIMATEAAVSVPKSEAVVYRAPADVKHQATGGPASQNSDLCQWSVVKYGHDDMYCAIPSTQQHMTQRVVFDFSPEGRALQKLWNARTANSRVAVLWERVDETTVQVKEIREVQEAAKEPDMPEYSKYGLPHKDCKWLLGRRRGDSIVVPGSGTDADTLWRVYANFTERGSAILRKWKAGPSDADLLFLGELLPTQYAFLEDRWKIVQLHDFVVLDTTARETPPRG